MLFVIDPVDLLPPPQVEVSYSCRLQPQLTDCRVPMPLDGLAPRLVLVLMPEPPATDDQIEWLQLYQCQPTTHCVVPVYPHQPLLVSVLRQPRDAPPQLYQVRLLSQNDP